MKEKRLDRLKEVISSFLGEDSDRWVHWINRFMQKKILG